MTNSTDPSSNLRTLPAYLKATHSLLSVILQIPPIGSNAALRTAFLLRLTGDFLSSVVGYTPYPDVLLDLLEWLDTLDRGWLTVLRSQVWDPKSREGVDLQVLAEKSANGDDARVSRNASEEANLRARLHSDRAEASVAAVAVSQTDRTRLRSLLITGSDRLEDWMEGLHVEGAADLETALELLGLREGFEELFLRTLTEMGELS